MEPTTVAALVAAGTEIASQVKDGIDTAIDLHADLSNNSLTKFTKMTSISSRAYIDGSLMNDPVLTDVLKTCQTMYVGFVLNALQLNTLVTAGVKVRDMLRVVATEDYHEDVAKAFESYAGEPSAANNNATTSKGDRGTTYEIKPVDSNVHLPVGKIIEVTLTNPTNKDASIKVSLLVQLLPYIIPAAIVDKVINYEYFPTIQQRWLQWRTGEISFWKDFIGQVDLIRNRDRVSRADTSGVLLDMYRNQTKSQAKVAANLHAASKGSDNRYRNIASAVLVFNEANLAKAKRESGIDLSNPNMRQQYFEMTFAMIIAVVDTMFNTVTIYLNGIDNGSTYSFDQLKGSAKKDNIDIVSILAAMSQGKTPRF